MKQTIIMLLAAVLLGSANVFSQSYIDGYKGDVNGDGTVDVADIASVIQIMADGGWINTKPTYPVKADFTGLKIESGSSTQYIEHGRTATWEVSLAPGYVDWFSTITNARVIGDGDIRRIISNPVDTAGFDVTATASTEKIEYYVYFGATLDPNVIESSIPTSVSNSITSSNNIISNYGWYKINISSLNELPSIIIDSTINGLDLDKPYFYVILYSEFGFVPRTDSDLDASIEFNTPTTWSGNNNYTLWMKKIRDFSGAWVFRKVNY